MDDLCAVEVVGAALAAVVEDEAEVDGEVEFDAEDVGLDGGAEADGGLQVHEPVQQRAAGQVRRRADLGLDEAQHVGAHAQLQRVPGAVVAAAGRRRRWRRRQRRRGRRGRTVGRVRHGGQDQAHSQEERRSSCHRDRASCLCTYKLQLLLLLLDCLCCARLLCVAVAVHGEGYL